ALYFLGHDYLSSGSSASRLPVQDVGCTTRGLRRTSHLLAKIAYGDFGGHHFVGRGQKARLLPATHQFTRVPYMGARSSRLTPSRPARNPAPRASSARGSAPPPAGGSSRSSRSRPRR